MWTFYYCPLPGQHQADMISFLHKSRACSLISRIKCKFWKNSVLVLPCHHHFAVPSSPLSSTPPIPSLKKAILKSERSDKVIETTFCKGIYTISSAKEVNLSLLKGALIRSIGNRCAALFVWRQEEH